MTSAGPRVELVPLSGPVSAAPADGDLAAANAVSPVPQVDLSGSV